MKGDLEITFTSAGYDVDEKEFYDNAIAINEIISNAESMINQGYATLTYELQNLAPVAL